MANSPRYFLTGGARYQVDQPGLALIDRDAPEASEWVATFWTENREGDTVELAKRVVRFLNGQHPRGEGPTVEVDAEHYHNLVSVAERCPDVVDDLMGEATGSGTPVQDWGAVNDLVVEAKREAKRAEHVEDLGGR